MTTRDPHRGPAGEDPGAPDPAPAPRPTLLEQMGGPRGVVLSAVPVVVLVAATAFLSLTATVVVSVADGLAVAGYRLLCGEGYGLAVGGLRGLAVAVGLVAPTGSARDSFVVGIRACSAVSVVALGSVLARRPLTGAVWNLVHGGTHDWRADRGVLRAHDAATLAAAAVFGVRFAVQPWLHASDHIGWSGVARIAMGWPLTILAGPVVVRAWRRSSARLLPTRA